MKKTKLLALLLTVAMALSLMVAPAAAASGNPYAVPGTTYGGNPYAPVVLGPGTVVKEEQSPYNLVRVFMENQVVVTMDERFVLDYTSTAAYTNRGFSSKGGYAWLAEAAINRALNDKSLARATNGTITYGDKVINLSTADGKPLPIDYLVTNFFRQPVTQIKDLDTVCYTLTYRNGTTATSYIAVQSYGDAIPTPGNSPTTPIYSYCDIWNVRDLDDETIEVYLRNGMIVTMEKKMIVDWVGARQRLGKDLSISYWHDWWEMDDDGADACVNFCQTLLDALIIQGWTVYPAEAIQPNYSHRAYPARDVLSQSATTRQVLVRSLERLRTADTTSDVAICFDYSYYSPYYGRWTDTTEYQMSFEFICRDRTTASGYNFYALTRPEHFLQSFNAVQSVWLTDRELEALKR